MTADATDTNPLEYSESHTVDDKLDYIAFHLRAQTAVLDEMRREQSEFYRDILARVNSIGQNTTNVEAFCQEVRSAVEGARKNPLMRGMMPPLLPPGMG